MLYLNPCLSQDQDTLSVNKIYILIYKIYILIYKICTLIYKIYIDYVLYAFIIMQSEREREK